MARSLSNQNNPLPSTTFPDNLSPSNTNNDNKEDNIMTPMVATNNTSSSNTSSSVNKHSHEGKDAELTSASEAAALAQTLAQLAPLPTTTNNNNNINNNGFSFNANNVLLAPSSSQQSSNANNNNNIVMGEEDWGFYGQLKEQDRLLPIANVSRIMKMAVPASAKISKEAKDTVNIRKG